MIVHLFKTHVKGSEKKAIVRLVEALLCNLTTAVVKGVGTECNKVYINTRVIKHVYDKRPAEEFDFLIENVAAIVKYPDLVYKNKTGKRGSFCFVKSIKNLKYLCSVETTKRDDMGEICEVATFFRVEEEYLKNYELLWEWKDGTPSS